MFKKWRSPRMAFAMAQLDTVINMATRFLQLPLLQLENLRTTLPSVVQVDLKCSSVQFSSSAVSDFTAPWTAAHQAPLSITNSQSLLKLMSIKSVMLPLAKGFLQRQ